MIGDGRTVTYAELNVRSSRNQVRTWLADRNALRALRPATGAARWALPATMITALQPTIPHAPSFSSTAWRRPGHRPARAADHRADQGPSWRNGDARWDSPTDETARSTMQHPSQQNGDA
ncbi:hypothetical protein GCM10010191_23150 [Actinomadura vinacea]|uniref:Uncharacterized protein n=1 Tax=Actinomadura vinacea TaxID=115336 RepID=A0ABN3ISU8_9ACTN